MTIYLDLLFLFNWWIDFFLLIVVKLTLKRMTKIIKIIVASFIGALSIIFLFLNINYINLLITKLLLGIIMCIIAFNFKSISYTINNLIYLIMSGIILGGAINLIKPYLDHNNFLYFLFVIFITPFVLFGFVNQNKKFKKNYSLYYQVKIIFTNLKEINLSAFLDTGNKLIDPITNKPIILVEKSA